MSRRERSEELRRLWEEEERLREIERNRKAGLPMGDRIDELEVSDELKDVLHRLANGERE
jgi:hypothetical protein